MQQVAFPLAAITADLAHPYSWSGGVQVALAQRPKLRIVLQAVLFWAVWGSQVAICVVQEEPLWQYDLAMLCGWAALAAFYGIHRLFNPLIFT